MTEPPGLLKYKIGQGRATVVHLTRPSSAWTLCGRHAGHAPEAPRRGGDCYGLQLETRCPACWRAAA